VRGEAEIEQAPNEDGPPDQVEVLDSAECGRVVVVQHGEQDAVEDGLDAGVGGVEDVITAAEEDVAEDDDER